ncbi:hypothetical protein MmazTMA_30560 [Methanosarcina mazei]|mgnify:CR=1 FL=1|jgi:hypothetical protein|nr:hypothetical protein MmazTMA_30560 [Methanosarcina mazei]
MIEHLLYNIIVCSLTEASIRNRQNNSVRTKKNQIEKKDRLEKVIPRYSKPEISVILKLRVKKTEKL